MLQVHSFIPHTHSLKTAESHSHSHSKGDQSHKHYSHSDHSNTDSNTKQTDPDNDHDESPLNDLVHDAEFGKTLLKPISVKISIEQYILFVPSFFQNYDRIISFAFKEKHFPRQNKTSLFEVFLSHNIPLRAPPAA
jgi:hypothetical protein